MKRLTVFLAACLGIITLSILGTPQLLGGGRLVAVANAANQIPAGCPSSDNPAQPGQYPASCAQIPLGCPGSSLQGPPSAGFNPSTCPYDAQGNPQSSVAAGKPCGSGSNTVTTGVDVGCQNTGNPIYDYLRAIIRFIAGIFGILAVLIVIISGIQYITSSGNPQAIAAAKKRLVNVIISIVLFVLMFGILNYLIPGGVL